MGCAGGRERITLAFQNTECQKQIKRWCCVVFIDKETAGWYWRRRMSSFRGLAPMGDKGQKPVS